MMKKHISQLFLIVLVMFVVFAATLGVLYVADLVSLEQLTRYTARIGIILLIIMSASFVVSAATSFANSRSE